LLESCSLRLNRQIYKNKNFFLDTQLFHLERMGELVEIEPRVFDLLIYLIENRNRVVERNELLEELWEGRVVSEDALTARLKAARKAVGDTGSAQNIIKTIHGRGYQFVAEISESDVSRPRSEIATKLTTRQSLPQPQGHPKTSPKSSREISSIVFVVVLLAAVVSYWYISSLLHEEPVSAEGMAFPIPDKPLIAVLAFDNLSGDPGQEYLSDGISESIITALSRIPDFFVIARQSSFSYKDNAIKAKEIASELGVQYIIDGSVQKSDSKVRVTAQLIDALSGHHLWTQQYNRQWEDIFALQDDITQHIVANISSNEGPLLEAILERVKQKAPTDLRAYDYLLLGREHLLLASKEDNARARELFLKALKFDQNYSLGHAWLAWTYHLEVSFGWSEESTLLLEKALHHAQKAVELDNTESVAHWVLASVLALIGEQPEVALAEYEKTLSLNPNNADILADYGWSIARLGRAEDGVEFVKKAMRLNPVHPDWYGEGLMHALYISRRYQEAIAVANTITISTITNYLDLAGSYAQSGQLSAAKETAARILDLEPDFSIGWWRKRVKFTDPADLDHYLEGLRIAGLPE